MKLDSETEIIFSEGDKLKQMTESAGWSIARERLLKKAATLLNIADLSDINPDTIIKVIGIRQETAKNLLSWMKEIESDVEQHQSNIPTFEEITTEYIVKLE